MEDFDESIRDILFEDSLSNPSMQLVGQAMAFVAADASTEDMDDSMSNSACGLAGQATVASSMGF